MSSTEWNMKTFVKGASILSFAAIFVKILSVVYRVPFQNMVGDKGFYIYQQVYPFIGIFIVWTSYGFAVAVSKLIADSKDIEEENTVKRISFSYLVFISLLFFVMLTLAAPFFAAAMGDSQLTTLLKAGAYIVLTLPALAVLKGTFQAEGNMMPVAVSNVGEQLVRVTIILLGAWLTVRAGSSFYQAGEIAVWGGTAGQAAGVVILLLYGQKIFNSPVRNIPKLAVIKKLTVVSISLSASSLILLLFQLIDSFTILNGLTAQNILAEDAMIMKGVYDRGSPLVQMGIVIATTLSVSIVPLIAHHAAKKDGNAVLPFIRVTYKVAVLFGWAAAIGLGLILPYVNEMLFETRDGSAVLIVYCFQIFWLSLLLPLTAILQGAGNGKLPILLFIGGLFLKLAANYMLIPSLQILGAALAGNIGLAFITGGLLLYFKKVWPIRLAPWRFYGWLFAAASAMSGVLLPLMTVSDRFLESFLPSRISALFIALVSAGVGAVIFISIVMKSRIMAEKDWYLLPFGKRLATVQLWLHRKKIGR